MDEFFPTNREFAASIDSIDRRLFKRHPYGVIVEAVWLDAFQMVIRAVHQYRTMDLSRGGIRLLGRQMHYEGTIGVVILPRRDAPPTRYGVRVRNSVYNGAQMYATGCAFQPVDPRLERATRVEHGRLMLSARLEDFL